MEGTSRCVCSQENAAFEGIVTDTSCSVYGSNQETIFFCSFSLQSGSRYVGARSSFLLPLAGFSINSVFLSFHHLLACSKKHNIHEAPIPWIIWQIWKAWNAFYFEQTQYDTDSPERLSQWFNIWVTRVIFDLRLMRCWYTWMSIQDTFQGG